MKRKRSAGGKYACEQEWGGVFSFGGKGRCLLDWKKNNWTETIQYFWQKRKVRGGRGGNKA